MRLIRVPAARSRAVRVGGAAVAMVIVAELAVWLLAPRDGAPDPVPVAAGEYFDAAELERANEFRSGQRRLFFAGLAIEAVVLVGLALGCPAATRRALERLGRRPIAGAALAGAGVAVAVEVATLPTRLWAHERAVEFGLSTQALGPWLWDVARSGAITALLAAAGAAILLALVRRLPRLWWVAGSGAVIAIAVVFVWLAPVVLAPIFNRFEPLPADSRLRAEVLELAERAGVEVGEVYAIDASRRVTALNAYVDGIGPTKRVVLYDNLIAAADRAELESVVAHELAHQAHDDIPRGITYIALVAPLGLLFSRELALALAERTGADPARPAAVPAYLLAIAIAAFILAIPGNQLSRQVEAAADRFALELTGDPQGLIDLQLRLARNNLSDPDPPAALTALFGTHPPTVERIGAALAYERELRPGPRTTRR